MAFGYQLAYWKRIARDYRAHWQAAEREVESTTRWAQKALDEQYRLSERCTYLYGLAARHGATDEELRGPS